MNMILPELLSENERNVLYGLTVYPYLNDRQLAEKLDYKVSTLTSIKNRLKTKDYYREEAVLSFGKVGFRILQFTVGSGHLLSHDELFDVVNGVEIDEDKRTIYLTTEDNNFLIMTVFRDFHEAKKWTGDIRQQLQDRYKRYATISSVQYHIPDILGFYHLEHQRALGRILGMKKKMPRPDLYWLCDLKPLKMRKLEKKVLFGLVRYPDIPDNKISEKINVTRQAISRAKYNFRKRRMIRNFNVPNMEKLGTGLFSFIRMKLRSDIRPDALNGFIYTLIKKLTPSSLIYDKCECCCICYFDDMNDLRERTVMLFNSRLKSVLGSEPDEEKIVVNNILSGPPVTSIFSLKRMKNHHSFNSSLPIEGFLEIQ